MGTYAEGPDPFLLFAFCELRDDLHPKSRVVPAKAMSLSGIIPVWRPR